MDRTARIVLKRWPPDRGARIRPVGAGRGEAPPKGGGAPRVRNLLGPGA
jgi:hypothetical protein